MVDAQPGETGGDGDGSDSAIVEREGERGYSGRAARVGFRVHRDELKRADALWRGSDGCQGGV